MSWMSGETGTYPTTVPYERVTFPVKKVGTRALLALEELQNQRYVIGPEKSDLWQLQLAVFAARMEMLKWMIPPERAINRWATRVSSLTSELNRKQFCRWRRETSTTSQRI